MTDMTEVELQRVLQQNAREVRLTRLETVRNRSIALWAGALTVITVLLVLAVVFRSGVLFELAMTMIIPAIAGGVLHGNYFDRINALQKEMKGKGER